MKITSWAGAVALAIASSAGLVSDVADACSCAHDETVRVISPRPGDAAPTNARIFVHFPDTPAAGTRFVLRASAGGETPLTVVDRGLYAELVPASPLRADQKYALAQVRAAPRPQTVVFSAFRTGSGPDTAAPAPVRASGEQLRYDRARSTCAGPGTQVNLQVGPATPTLIALWFPDAAGLATSRPPDRITWTTEGAIGFGNTHACADRSIALRVPRLAVAAVDAAGNTSAPVTVKLVERRGH